MPALWWMTSLGNEGVTYGDFNRLQLQRQRIAEELTRRGFTNVRVAADISGTKNGCFISIAHLSHPVPNRWWEVIIGTCDGNNIQTAQTVVNQAFNAIRFTW
ncbi:hypothetical protein [Brevibacillus dissolubilis]|uniref:hypothetical protein n=1 Tax=Brevibacillus dissolubilis TaxID=1844116 RepID=UPI001117289B|nr:hypothetical protein [Brevibacillus dissolubilis]